jgi:hypothetical protein
MLYLLGIAISGGGVAVPLAINGRVTATTNSIHLPLREVVVDDVDIATSAPGHPLDQLLAEVIEGYGHLHPRVRQVLVAVAQQHHLIVIREIVVRYRDPGRPHHRVNQAVLAVR